jgi:DNA-binding transcriptional MerR regulator
MTHEKQGDVYLQIGDAAERTELTQRTLRYYEEKGLLRSPTRMDGGFRLYSAEDIQRIDRIKQLKELLGFSLADIKEMLEAEDVLTQIKTEWRKDADAVEKAEKLQTARKVTMAQLALIDQKMAQMADMRSHLIQRMEKYDHWLRQWTGEPVGS